MIHLFTRSLSAAIYGMSRVWICAIQPFLQGLFDSIAVWRLKDVLITNSKVAKRFLHCFLLNGVVFIGSIGLYSYVIEPIINAVLRLPIGSPMEDFEGLKTLFYCMFFAFWLLPIYLVSFILNTRWYQEIIDGIQEHFTPRKTTSSRRKLTGHATDGVSRGTSSPRTTSAASVVDSFLLLLKALSDELYRVFIVVVFLAQATIVGLLPAPTLILPLPQWFPLAPLAFFFPSIAEAQGLPLHVPTLIAHILTTIIYAYYSFEYRWASLATPLEHRFAWAEANTAYFIGFGSLLALATVVVSPLAALGMFSALFPVAAALALVARLPPLVLPSQAMGVSTRTNGSPAISEARPTETPGANVPVANEKDIAAVQAEIPTVRVPLFFFTRLVNDVVLTWVRGLFRKQG